MASAQLCHVNLKDCIWLYIYTYIYITYIIIYILFFTRLPILLLPLDQVAAPCARPLAWALLWLHHCGCLMDRNQLEINNHLSVWPQDSHPAAGTQPSGSCSGFFLKLGSFFGRLFCSLKTFRIFRDLYVMCSSWEVCEGVLILPMSVDMTASYSNDYLRWLLRFGSEVAGVKQVAW